MLTSVMHAGQTDGSTHLAMLATTLGWRASMTSRPCCPFCRPPHWQDCRHPRNAVCTRVAQTNCQARWRTCEVQMQAGCQTGRTLRQTRSQDWTHLSHLYAGLFGLHSRHPKKVKNVRSCTESCKMLATACNAQIACMIVAPVGWRCWAARARRESMISALSRQPSAGQPSADGDRGMCYMSMSVLPVGWRRGTAREVKAQCQHWCSSQGKHKWMQKVTIGQQNEEEITCPDADECIISLHSPVCW